jgi:hypothetical protein
MFKSRRTLANILLFGSFALLPFMPWYALFVGGAIAAWYFPYYEFILLGFLMDVSFSSSHMSMVTKELVIDSSIPFVSSAPSLLGTFFFTLISAAIVLVLQIVKKRVRFYS